MKILCVIVRFRTSLCESPAMQGLCDALSSHPDLARSYTVMVWDNSPKEAESLQFPIPFFYRHSASNLGVSGAYNGAMRYALEHGYPWMLLLDQDTRILPEILSGLLRHAIELLPRQEIAAIAPTVKCGDIVISPSRRLFGRNRGYSAQETGIAFGEAAAINSGCIIRVASLQTIGGFSTDFWLDYSDLYVFHQFFLHGMKVWLAEDVALEHDMTMMDYDRLMTPWRCTNLCRAESAFNDLYDRRLESWILNLRLLARAIKHRIKYKNVEFSRIAWDQFLYRLSVPRRKRVTQWIEENKMRVS